MEGTRKVRVSGRTDTDVMRNPNIIPTGYTVEAEYHHASGPDRDAAFAFVERVVRIMEDKDEDRGAPAPWKGQ